MSKTTSCKCPGCGTDISVGENGFEFSTTEQQNAAPHAVCESLIELGEAMNEQMAYLQGFMDAMNQKIDAMQLQIIKQASEKKE